VLKRVSWPGVIVVAGSTAYSWFNASPHVAQSEPAPRTNVASSAEVTAPAAGPEASAAALASMQLHDWSPKAPQKGRPDRNIFTFTHAVPKAAPAPPPPAPGLLAGGDGKTAPLVLFKLIGVAEDQGPDGVSRTAIISGQGQLYMVKEGETLAWIYRVGRLSGESVELVDTTGGEPLRLSLK
jgi:hypothetical protein